MADESSADLISVPQGGGAVRGLGEMFQPDLHTGTGNFSVPLEVPPGRGGFAPKLALSYSSGNGNGPFGLGWQLSVPGVRRKTDKQIPRYDGTDVFMLSGAEDLVPVRGGDEGVQRYRPKTDALCARVEHHTRNSNHWVVWTKDGLRSTYGTPRPEDADVAWRDLAVVADPTDASRVTSWMLSSTVDTCGNTVAYTYRRDPADSTGAQHYLAQIGYADYGNPATFLVQIRFIIEPRFDRHIDRRAGFPISTGARYAEIQTWIQTEIEQKVRTVALSYDDGFNRQGDNGVSLLGRITVTGHEGESTETMPPLEFGYSGWEPQSRRFLPLGGSAPTASLASGDLDMVDMFGTGLPDVLQLSGANARYWRNRGSGLLDQPRSLTSAPAGVSLGAAGVQTLDADGDGRPDILVTDASGAGYYPIGTKGGFDPHGYTAYAKAPSFDLTDPNTRLIDLDGDGVTDAIHIGSSVQVYYSRLVDGSPVRSWVTEVVHGSPLLSVSLADPRVKFADMSGDGLTDVVLVGNGHVRYWPNLGYGVFGDPVDMAASPRFDDANLYGSTGVDPARLLIGDVDGDGLADIAYIGTRGTTVWINQGSAFSAPVFIPGTPQPDRTSAVRLADMLGTGTAGVLWTFDSRPQGDSRYKFLDLTGGTKPYLLTTIRNHMGGHCSISYAPSTRYALADAAAGRRWRTTMPFPVQVVASVVAHEEFSSSTSTTEFAYHHGYWDGADREFRGFGRVDQFDTTTFDRSGGLPQDQYSPPIETRTWFHSGPVGPEFGGWTELDLSAEHWPEDADLLGRGDRSTIPDDLPRRQMRDVIRCFRGSLLRSEMYARDGSALQDRPYTVTEHCYDLTPVIDPPPSGDSSAIDDYWRMAPVVAAHQSGTRTTQWERGTDPKTQVSLTGSWDRYGNPTSTLSVAFPRGSDPRSPRIDGQPWLVTATTLAYAVRDDDVHYLCDRSTGKRTEEILNDGSYTLHALARGFFDGTLPRRTLDFARTFYDGEAFVGLPFGQLGDHGLPTATATLALTRGALGASHDPAAPPAYLAGSETLLANGLRGDYFRDDALTELAFTRSDGFIRFSWHAGGPDPYLCQPTYSVRWTGQLHADFTEMYSLTPVGNGGVRLWVDGTQVLDSWGGLSGSAASVPLVAGTAHALTVEYRATGWDAAIQLRWSSRGQPDAIIDAEHLSPPSAYRPQPWLSEYPEAFRAALPACAGYRYQAGQDGIYDAGYYIVTGTAYDDLGMPVTRRDSLGHDTRIAYDTYHVRPATVTNPAGHVVSADFDYRVLKPRLVTDANGCRTEAGYSPLGLLAWVATLGHEGAHEGETVEQPGVRYAYELTAYDASPTGARAPTTVLTTRRVNYRWSIITEANAKRTTAGQPALTDAETLALFPANEETAYPERFIHSRTYYDGLGRVLQTRAQADDIAVDELGLTADLMDVAGDLHTLQDTDLDNPRVLVNGWQTYDNKARVVQSWEPFFGSGWAYREPTDQLAALASTSLYYDARGEQVRVVHPDGSQDLVVRGVPADLAEPDSFAPTAWETFSYDADDNAGRTHAASSGAWSDQWNTPVSVVVDALGRAVSVTSRLSGRTVTTTSNFDIQGRLLRVIDPLGRTAAAAKYDLAGRPWSSTLLDAGTSLTVYDANGGPIEQRNANRALQLTARDQLRRLVSLWVSDTPGTATTLREVSVYDGAGLADAAAANLVGRLYRGYDEAGRLECSCYDLAGRLLSSTRAALSATTLLARYPEPFVSDWQAANGTIDELAETLVDQTRFSQDDTWDALGRRTSTKTPADSEGRRHLLTMSYSRAGTLTGITLDSASYLTQICHNARGQRVAVWLGNGVLTRFVYDSLTFRLLRQHSSVASPRADGGWRPEGPVLRDSGYAYDLVGNPLAIKERSPGCGTGASRDSLDRAFSYDGLYRLIGGTGREAADPLPDIWSAQPRGSDPTATQTYSETYQYDDVGGLLRLGHQAGTGGYTRTMTLTDGNNRLTSMSSGQLTLAYTYDAAGNLLAETDSRLFSWDGRNRMATFRIQSGSSAPLSLWVQYRYDSSGRRVLKLARDQGGDLELTTYPGGPLERITLVRSGTATSYDELHVHDSATRVAVTRLKALPDDRRPAVGYILADQLGSSTVVVGGTGGWVNTEEYLPYGETSYGSYARKRYRFVGSERDEESGLGYHGARYFLPWLCRWTAPDPDGLVDGPNLYSYVRSRPTVLRDVIGRYGESAPSASAGNGSAESEHSEHSEMDPLTVAGAPRPPPVNATDPNAGRTFVDEAAKLASHMAMAGTRAISKAASAIVDFLKDTGFKLAAKVGLKAAGVKADVDDKGTKSMGIESGPVSASIDERGNPKIGVGVEVKEIKIGGLPKITIKTEASVKLAPMESKRPYALGTLEIASGVKASVGKEVSGVKFTGQSDAKIADKYDILWGLGAQEGMEAHGKALQQSLTDDEH